MMTNKEIIDQYEQIFPVSHIIIDNDNLYMYDAKSRLLTECDIEELREMVLYSKNCVKNAGDRKYEFVIEGAFERVVPCIDTLPLQIKKERVNKLPTVLTLELTEKCNLRCTYCLFLEETGFESRTHSPLSMDKETAFKAIDLYFTSYIKGIENCTSRDKIIKTSPPTLQWWGGEPFLEFDLIKTTREYFENKNWAQFGIGNDLLQYGLTTNLTIEDVNILDYCQKFKFNLKVSLDGDENSHDSNRKFANGKGSFACVQNNLDYIIRNYPDYAKSHIGIISVLSDSNDNNAAIDFLKKRYSLDTVNKELAGHIITGQRKVGSVLSELDKSESTSSVVELFDRMLKSINLYDLQEMSRFFQKNLSFQSDLISVLEIEDLIVFDKPFANNRRDNRFSCSIGYHSIMVSTNGDIHFCGKSDYSMPIGHIEKGVSHNKLMDFYEEYYSAINKKCKACWAIDFCVICPAIIVNNAKICLPSNNECQNIRRNAEIKLLKYIHLSQHYRSVYDFIRKIKG